MPEEPSRVAVTLGTLSSIELLIEKSLELLPQDNVNTAKITDFLQDITAKVSQVRAGIQAREAEVEEREAGWDKVSSKKRPVRKATTPGTAVALIAGSPGKKLPAPAPAELAAAEQGALLANDIQPAEAEKATKARGEDEFSKEFNGASHGAMLLLEQARAAADAAAADDPAGAAPPKKGAKLPSYAHTFLRHWLVTNWHHPYPSKEDSIKLRIQTGMTLTQISQHFCNARRRIVKPVSEGKRSIASVMLDYGPAPAAKRTKASPAGQGTAGGAGASAGAPAATGATVVAPIVQPVSAAEHRMWIQQEKEDLARLLPPLPTEVPSSSSSPGSTAETPADA